MHPKIFQRSQNVENVPSKWGEKKSHLNGGQNINNVPSKRGEIKIVPFKRGQNIENVPSKRGEIKMSQ